ncbi:MAG: FG-GAP repeat protein, partial [Dehalococcoidales bacterium]|nr:FG-GAP repeat protein [Dehalococcoidales bacterium]
MKKTGYLLLASIIMLGSLFLPGVVVYAFNPDTPLSGADASFLGENQNDYSGYSVAPAGDVNGDGYDDLLIGAYRHNNYTGKTYLILGKDPPNWGSGFNLAAADASFLGENQDDYSGHAVASAGDINNDGYDDFLIGAYWKDTENGGLSGKAYLILGKNTPDWGNNYSLANADASYLGEDGSDHAGCSVSIAGDVNNDGYDDFLIGAYQNDAGGSWKGKAYLILGSNDPNKWQTNLNLSGADAAFCGENNFDYAGCAVSTAGDVNGDDYDDFLIGAWGNSEVQDDAGETYLILGKDTPDWGNNYPLSNAQASFRGEAEDDRSGSSVATAGDVNGDGYDDCLIGAYWNDYSASSAGQAYLVLGESTPGWGMNFALSGADASFVGETSYDYAGFSIATAGDINSDGFDDFLIGAYSANGSSIGAGKTYLMMGNTETNWGRHFALSGADASFLGEELNDESGISVASAGDVNNDGFPDLLIGANRYDDDENEIDNIGKTYLLLGRAAPGITVSDISGDTTEAGGTATFTIVLNTEPSADVTIDLSSDDTTEGTVLPTSVTFTSGNSDSPQTVTVTGVDDYIDDGDIIYNIITAAATSEDTNYDDLDADDVAVTNTDDDTAGITVSTISGNTTEAGGTADFTIVLDSQPTANVTIGLSSDDTSEGTVSPTS